MAIVVIWVVFAVLAGVLASSKGRSVLGWVVLSLLLTPLTILILLALENLNTREERRLAIAANAAIVEQSRVRQVKPAENLKVCPQCAEEVKAAAKICRFCGHKFEEPAHQSTLSSATSPNTVLLRAFPLEQFELAGGVKYKADGKGYFEAAPDHVTQLLKIGCARARAPGKPDATG